jgi:Putative type VII ESX secretion system translocon, EccE
VAERAGSSRVRYRFSPLERRGVVAGWRGGQVAAVATGMTAAVLALRSAPSVGGVVVAVAIVGGAVALAFWPIQGRTGEQWLPLVARWTWAKSTGSGRSLAPGPRAGHVSMVDRAGTRSTPLRPGGDGRPGPGPGPARARSRVSPFDRLEVVGAPFGPEPSSAEMGMVVDGRARTATAVLAVRGHSFALLGPADQDARIASWARVLAALAREGSEVHRVQWTESCLPDDGTAVRRHWADHAVLGPDSPAGRSYRSLVEESAPVTRRHQVMVALTVSSSRSSRSIRSAGGGRAGTGTVLAREVLAMERALDAADIAVDGVLGPGALRRVLGESFAAAGRSGGGAPRVDDPDVASSPWPWPMAVEPHWDAVRTDGTWHATYWIAEWPRVDVTPDFLGPLLFSPLRRTITLTMEPVSPSRAARQVAHARTADIADGELRRRGGFLVTARHSREKESVEERDVELADGHAQYRFTGYVTVTADTRADLVDACAAVEQAAGHARVELRQLYGEQEVAFTCSLPLGRGLT